MKFEKKIKIKSEFYGPIYGLIHFKLGWTITAAAFFTQYNLYNKKKI